jgi:hypothetical protein
MALGATRYEGQSARRGYRNGVTTRTLTGPTGPMALTLPRATLAAPGREQATARAHPRSRASP